MFSWHFGLENVSINQGNASLSPMKAEVVADKKNNAPKRAKL